MFTSPEQLVAGLPANARPKDAKDVIRLNRANDWLEANVAGKTIHLDYMVGTPQLERVRTSKDYLIIWPAGKKQPTHRLHGAEWAVRIETLGGFASRERGSIRVIVDEATAERLEEVKDQVVKLTAKIQGAAFGSSQPFFGGGPPDPNVLVITATDFTINGIKTANPPLPLKGKGKGKFGVGEFPPKKIP